MESRVSKVVQQFGRLIAWLFISFCWIGCHSHNEQLPYYHSAKFTPLWEDEDQFKTDTLHRIAAFEFIDQQNEFVTNRTFDGKIYVANFFFTICPSICPKMTANLEKVAQAFEGNSDVKFISHSVTPDIDSVAQLKKYADDHGIRHDQWKLITGVKEKIYTLARQSYFAEQEIGFQNSTQEFLHTEHFILVDRQGHIRGIYKGTLELETERLIEDIKVLLKE